MTCNRTALTAIILLGIAAVANAWTPASDERIATKAAQLAPNDLRTLIERYDREYKDGLRRAEADEGSDLHRYFVLSRTGLLRDRIERETNGIIALIRGGKPMSDAVMHLGALAHYVADANNPFHVANDDPKLDSSHADYERYFERRLIKFPTVFYGLDPHFQLSPFLDQTFARTARFYPLLDEEYFRFGETHNSSEFDDRSTAFGVASVCYSRAVTDIVNLYYYIWSRAGGDVRTAPILRGGNLFLNNAN
ncbi:MAG TPA: hypothetical protein VLV78_18285 [Thermoanaerobaculia bacterium]|nr:hypothetical protein [Thermoanaerobaculia bacterium]